MYEYELFHRVKGRRYVIAVFVSREAAKARRDALQALEIHRGKPVTIFQISRVPAQVAA
ncbi:hypothetical protein [Xanthomonas hortorum]|uniref:hypothetical protein n=1 Tax=Xanthomonas hortorum TaxID=56454 RepID=UPI00204433C3|nr:hypothetical protein [Xanthomonas hortorum]MCM5526684.1 hypothetical protein [Xanthomonas hortorum pv. pelargonii]MCM5538595.1 hypothetical protein [Xanthomonas hortorum pv. pelargonii]MCM5542822.1 hypothetical protein [Xanthomonas hortorum pv. pelargonii]MCM5547087.1 hypothetical protein [Xanthomonas hortorum pv. pelargonii]MCM5550967.1 hypothetical protein [Xanthomonas hortorum pv. pelargonii]